MFLTDWINSIVSFVSGWHLERVLQKVKDSGEELWDKLTPEVQDVLKWSSAAVHFFQQGLDETPDFILNRISDTIPFFTRENLTEVLKKASIYINIGEEEVRLDNLALVAQSIQEKLKSLPSEEAKQWSEALADAIALSATPHDTTWSIISSVMKFAFKTFVKGKYALK